ncbi:hypothetical protein IWX90DRAFT_196490 [Phyllosticta citrichinensis]|uniref:Uncharacterized protein n=1 Tax=Phyllosticta citrichinensis TaxID=1130410 RepID=A0ABR1XXN0_9PEZI
MVVEERQGGRQWPARTRLGRRGAPTQTAKCIHLQDPRRSALRSAPSRARSWREMVVMAFGLVWLGLAWLGPKSAVRPCPWPRLTCLFLSQPLRLRERLLFRADITHPSVFLCSHRSALLAAAAQGLSASVGTSSTVSSLFKPMVKSPPRAHKGAVVCPFGLTSPFPRSCPNTTPTLAVAFMCSTPAPSPIHVCTLLPAGTISIVSILLRRSAGASARYSSLTHHG